MKSILAAILIISILFMVADAPAQFSSTGAGVVLPSGGGTGCTAGAIDLSLTTGCNIPFFIGGIFP
jgi:hypothetical protein